MNYLFHLYLAEPTPESLLGALMGDFVKGPLDHFPPALREGIMRHRRLDRFASESEDFRRSRRRLDESYGHCRAILVDVFYDHFLALRWSEYSPLPLETFAEKVYRLLQSRRNQLPPPLREVVPRMIAGNWLVSYRDPESVGIALERLSRRLRRPNPLADGLRALRAEYEGLEADFRRFLPAARDHLGPGTFIPSRL